MLSISDIQKKYSNKLDFLDLELILANSLRKTREFILTHPEHKPTKAQIAKCKIQIARRIKGEPVAYILGHKEFYDLDFIVNQHTLVPRPETEQIIELTLDELKVKSFAPSLSLGQKSKVVIIDIGTGSGNILISIANELEKHPEHRLQDTRYLGVDLSKEALKVAKKNARLHGLAKKIKFLHGSLLTPIIKNLKSEIKNSRIILLANLPYLSREIYQAAPIDVKKFEPKSALYSPEQGLQHYRKLLEQLKELLATSHQPLVTIFLEISPEQKALLTKLVKKILPTAKIEFQKDLAHKWRICKIQTS